MVRQAHHVILNLSKDQSNAKASPTLPVNGEGNNIEGWKSI